MRKLLARPLLVYQVVVPLLVVTWLLAGVAGDNAVPSTGGTKYVIASRSWALFLITFFATGLFCAALMVRRIVGRST